LAGVYMEDAAFYQGLRALCDEHGIVLIFDEVQTAPGRTGEWFAGYNWDVIPDVISTAKGIASGFPMGLVLVRDSIAETISYGEHGSTFGGGPMACAVAMATLEVIENENLLDNIKQVSQNAIAKLNALDIVNEVRGKGFLLGIETPLPAGEVRNHLVDNGILVGTSVQPNTIRLLPPLITQDEHIDTLIAALTQLEH